MPNVTVNNKLFLAIGGWAGFTLTFIFSMLADNEPHSALKAASIGAIAAALLIQFFLFTLSIIINSHTAQKNKVFEQSADKISSASTPLNNKSDKNN